MAVFSSEAYDSHERVVFCRAAEAGLRAIIAIHSTALGPAAGGCRMWPYSDEGAALRDVLRLSRGMSYKNALAGLPLGGGKAVIIGDPGSDKTMSMFEAFGDFVERLGGDYVTAEDVGVTMADLQWVANRTGHVCGLPRGDSRAGGDPAPHTAYGVYLGIAESVAFRSGRPLGTGLNGIRIALQGLGAVGYRLCAHLADAGAELFVTDLAQDRVRRACEEFDAKGVPPSEILAQPVDVFAPCALGGVINSATVSKLNASIVAGAANNQLETLADGRTLMDRGILYAPDYVINAGGIINVGYELLGLGDTTAVRSQIERIGPRLRAIYQRSLETGRPTGEIADAMARERLGRDDAPARQPREDSQTRDDPLI
jgi:leucine dehydrogenase